MKKRTKSPEEEKEDSMTKTWEFKGIELPPLTYARKSNLLSVINRDNFGPTDVAAFLYGCICDEADLRRARRDPSKFDEKVDRWMNKIQFGTDDFTEGATIVSEMISHSDSNQARPIEEDGIYDPLGNL